MSSKSLFCHVLLTSEFSFTSLFTYSSAENVIQAPPFSHLLPSQQVLSLKIIPNYINWSVR